MASGVIISVIFGGIELVDMAELDCSPTWETKDIVVCGSEGKRGDEAIMSGTLGKMDVLGVLEGALVTGGVTHETGVSL